MLKKNSFSTNSMDKRIKIFLNKKFSQKMLKHAVPKKELFSVLPYLGMSSLCLRTRLQRSINNNISFCKVKIIFKSSTRLANFFRFKDKIPLCLHSNLSSFYISLLQVLVANLVTGGILSSIFFILTLYLTFLIISFPTTSFSLLKSTGTGTNLSTLNLSTLLFKLLKLVETFFSLSYLIYQH